MWFITRRRHEEELAAAKAEIQRQRRRANDAEDRANTAEFNRAQILRQLAEADATNRRLSGRNLELGERLTALAESDPEYAADLETQLAEAREALAVETKRAEHLQRRLDDAVGLSAKGIADSSRWQPGYKPKADAS
jgi:chromosome segregation ATPase